MSAVTRNPHNSSTAGCYNIILSLTVIQFDSYAKLVFMNLREEITLEMQAGRVGAMCCDLENSHLEQLDQTCVLVHH
jgi:hypothetical protein